MADALKLQFGPEVPATLARRLADVHPGFDAAAFVAEACAGLEPLELMPRARHIAAALARHLPADFGQAATLVAAALGPPLEGTDGHGMAPFLYLPFVCYVEQHGLDHFEAAMHLQRELTRRFTAEFSIRAYLERHPQATLARLREWARDPDPHVRRLVSEGTRPRLPWARRLRDFQRDPAPVLELLELLKDDPEPYVRRSVANNLNDIGRDHPALLVAVARRWLVDAGDARRRLVRHALRSAVKRADPEALALLGLLPSDSLALRRVRITPARPRIGGAVTIAFELVNTGDAPLTLGVDLRVLYARLRGTPGPKVFKLRRAELAPGAVLALEKTLTLAQLSTRRHHPGRHEVQALVNGRTLALGAFELRAAAAG